MCRRCTIITFDRHANRWPPPPNRPSIHPTLAGDPAPPLSIVPDGSERDPRVGEGGLCPASVVDSPPACPIVASATVVVVSAMRGMYRSSLALSSASTDAVVRLMSPTRPQGIAPPRGQEEPRRACAPAGPRRWAQWAGIPVSHSWPRPSTCEQDMHSSGRLTGHAPRPARATWRRQPLSASHG